MCKNGNNTTNTRNLWKENVAIFSYLWDEAYKKWHSFNLISSLTYNYCFQVRSVKKASSVKDFVLKPPNLNLAPLKNKNVIVSEKLISKPIKKDLKTSFDSVPVPSQLTKVPITARTWPDSNISWDYVSPTIHDLGKVCNCCIVGVLYLGNGLKWVFFRISQNWSGQIDPKHFLSNKFYNAVYIYDYQNYFNNILTFVNELI